MRILVTGSTGFVGSHLVPKILENGHEVLEITRNLDVSKKLYGNKTQKHFLTNSQESLERSVLSFNPEIAIHLASFLTPNDDYISLQKLLKANIEFFCRLLDSLKSSNLNSFINTGTFAEYYGGSEILEPAYLYSATKTASRSILDYYSRNYKFKQVTVVPYSIYGTVDTQKRVVDIIIDSISSKKAIDFSPGDQVLDFIHINDVTDFYMTIIDKIHELPNKSNFQLGTGKGHTIKQVTSVIERLLNKKTNINWGAKSYRSSDVMYAVANTDYSIHNLDWQPKLDLEEGIRLFLSNKYDL